MELCQLTRVQTWSATAFSSYGSAIRPFNALAVSCLSHGVQGLPGCSLVLINRSCVSVHRKAVELQAQSTRRHGARMQPYIHLR